MANYDTWMAALSNDDDEGKVQKKLHEMRARHIKISEAAKTPRKRFERRMSINVAASSHAVGGAKPRSAQRRHSLAPTRMGLNRRQPSFLTKVRPKHNVGRARANWSKLRRLWRHRGHELAVWGRNFAGCFVKGAKFEWTTQEVGKQLEWAREEYMSHKQIEELLARRENLLDRLRRVSAEQAQKHPTQEASTPMKDKTGGVNITERGKLGAGLSSARHPKTPSHYSTTIQTAIRREQALDDPADLERRIATVDQALQSSIKRESKLHSITQTSRTPRRPTAMELLRATESARTGTAIEAAREELECYKDRKYRHTMEQMQVSSGDEIKPQPPVESIAQMTIDCILEPSDDPATGAPPCVSFTATINYPHYNNIVKARGIVRKHTLTITEYSATQPWRCLAQLPNIYTINLCQATQLFYGAWPPPAEIDWRTGLKLSMPSRPAYLIQRELRQAVQGQEQDRPRSSCIGSYGRSNTNGGLPEGTLKYFARVADWGRGPTEAVNAKKFFTPRIAKRLASAKKCHNERRAQFQKWIRLETAERERQNAVAQAATDEGTRIFLKFHANQSQARQTLREMEQREEEERERRVGHQRETWGVAVHNHHRAAKRRGESGKAAQVRRVKAQQNVLNSANKSTAALMQ